MKFRTLIVLVAVLSAAFTHAPLQAQSGTRGGGADAAAAAAFLAQQQQLAQQQAARARQAEQLAAQKADEERQRGGVVVVELFTSQGCSSCPPADAALKQIAQVAKDRDLRVYPLSFHVDYWNRLGWEDPFSHEDFSARQTTYAAKFDGNRIYTPQMIVNGSERFIGSDKKKAHEAITDALRKRPRANVDLQINTATSEAIEVAYRISGNIEDYALNVALIHTPEATKVPSGENAGRELDHVNVVRSFKVIVPTASTGKVELKVPEEFESDDFEIVGYLQNKQTFEIVGGNAVKAILALSQS